jgi:hypothetical protein
LRGDLDFHFAVVQLALEEHGPELFAGAFAALLCFLV